MNCEAMIFVHFEEDIEEMSNDPLKGKDYHNDHPVKPV